MKIVDTLKRLANGGGTVANLEAAITEFEMQRDAACAWLAGFDERRRELLLADDPAALANLRTERGEQEDRRDAAETALAQIRARLLAARDAARAKRWGALRAEDDAAVKRYLASAAIALADYRGVIAGRNKMLGECFAAEVNALAKLPALGNGNPVLAPDLLDIAAAAHEWVMRPKPEAKAKPVAVPARKVSRREDNPSRGSHAISGQPPPPLSAIAGRRPLRRDVPKAGELLVDLFRAGVDLPGGGQSVPGDRIALPAEKAHKLVESGAGDFVQLGAQIAPFPSSDVKITLPLGDM